MPPVAATKGAKGAAPGGGAAAVPAAPLFDVGLLLGLVSGLGSVKQLADGSAAYVADDEVLDCLYDIQRFLRRDEPASRGVVCQLADWNVLRQHVVPLLLTYASKFDIAFNAVKVCVFMTQPCDPDTGNPGEQLRALQRAKAALLEAGAALTAATSLLAEPLSRFAERGRMSEEDWKVVQLVLTLFRNLLAIPDPAPTAASGNDHLTRGRDVLLERLFQEDVLDLLLAVTQDANRLPFRNEAALLLEIFHELFRGASPEALFAAADRHAAAQAAAQAAGGAARATASKKDHEASAALRAALGGERAAAKAAVHAAGGAPRHSRFGGTYVRSLAGGGTALVRNTPVGPLASARAGAVGVTSGAFGRSKPRLVGPQRMAVADTSVELHAGAGADAFVPPPGGCGPTVVSTHIQAKLKALAEAFLSGPYNALMSVVLGDITVGRAPGLSDHEIHLRTLHFLRIAAFCTAFVRVANARKAGAPGGDQAAAEAADGAEEAPSPWAAISETMEGRAFHWVRTEWLRLCDAKPADADAPAMAAAGALLHQMLAVLLAALTSSNGPTASADRRVATALALRVLTDDTADEGVLATLHKMVRTFDPRRFSRTHMATLALAVDTVLRLLQALSDQADGHLHVTRRRAGAGGGGGKKSKKQLAAEEAAMTEEERAAAAAERERLAQDKAEKAAKRQERIDAGEPVSDEEEDVAADLAEAGIAMGDDDDPGYGSGSDGGATGAQLREVKLDLPKRTARLFDPQTVCNLVWLLTNWRHNERRVNDVAVQLLDRMAALSLSPMLYQLSILLVFQDILGDGASRQPGHETLHSFVRKTVRGMFERMLPPTGPSTPDGGAVRLDGDEEDGEAAPAPVHRSITGPELAGKMLFVDLLFWKPRGTAVNIELDCGRFDGAGGEHLRSVAANRADIAGAIARDGAGNATTTPEGAAQPLRRKRRGGLLNEQADLLASLFEAHKDEPKKKVFATTLCQAMADGGCPLKRSQLYAQLRGLGLVRPDMVRKPRDGDGGNPQSRAQRREAARQAMNFDEDDDAAGSDEEDDEDDGEVAEPGGSGDDDDGAAAPEVDVTAAARAALGASRLVPRAELANPSRILAAGTMGALRAAGVLDTAVQWLAAQLEAAALVPDTMPVDGQEGGDGELYTLACDADDAAAAALLSGPHTALLAPLLHALALRRPDTGDEPWRWRVAPGSADGVLEALHSAQAMHDMQHSAAEERARAAAEARRARNASLGGGDTRAPLALLPGGASQRGVVIRHSKPGAAQPPSRRRSSPGAARKPGGRRRQVLLEDDSEEEAEDASGASESEPEAAEQDDTDEDDDAPAPAVQSFLTAGRGRRGTAPVDASQPVGLSSQGEAAAVGDLWAADTAGGRRQSQPSQKVIRSTQDVVATVFGSDSDDDDDSEAEDAEDAMPASVPMDLPVSAPQEEDNDEDMDVGQAEAAPARKRVFKRTAGGAAKRQAVAEDSDSGEGRVRASQPARRVMVLDEDSD